MAIKSDSAGGLTTLSFESHIVPEFITDNATPSSLRPHSLSEYYVDGGLVPAASPQNDNIPTSGTIQFSDFYGAVNVIKVEIFEDKSNINNNFYLNKDGDSVTLSKFLSPNLYNIADTFIPTVAGEQNVPFDFIIDSDACFNNSIQTGGYFNSLTITNKGIIAGRGGTGGSNGGTGQAGNAGIRIAFNSNKIVIDNRQGGYIAGGGGGGGGGTLSNYGSTARAGGGGGWNGGNGGGCQTSGPGHGTTASGGSPQVIKSKSDNSSGSSGTNIRTSNLGFNFGNLTNAGGGQAGGGSGGAIVARSTFTDGSPTLYGAGAGSGGGGGNKITVTASFGTGGTGNSSFAREKEDRDGSDGGSNSNGGGSGYSGGGGGWGAAGGNGTASGGAAGKAVQRTGTVTTLTYTTGTGTYYGTKDT
jgi:hypothetical protein